MGKKDSRVDAYIKEAAPFARPILTYLRKIIHEGCPAATETMKWHMPFFEYRGVLVGMPAFKAHCALVFWRDIVLEPDSASDRNGRGQFGRITSLADLPPRAKLLGYVRSAVRQRDNPAKPTKKPVRRSSPAPVVPPDFKRALANHRSAREHFEKFSPSQQRDYIEWITEAKKPETRTRRILTALEWLAEGKSRNWKYE